MEVFEGNLLKMKSACDAQVKYHLNLEDTSIYLNDLIGKEISFEFTGQINCIACGEKTYKSFGQGYCYKCFVSVPETSECIMNPELCQAHLGISRDMKWSESYCLTDHYVYLAISGNLKVGVTRASQVPTRWIDQGAVKAIKLALTPNRHLAGLIEVGLKNYFSDKTSWQKMLRNEMDSDISLVDEKQKAWEFLDEELQQYVTEDDEIQSLNYPVIKYPEKVKSFTFDNTNLINGKLAGIKGQYLIFDNGGVLNIRRHSGYRVKLRY